MASSTSEYSLELTPSNRFDIIDVNAALRMQHGDVLSRFTHALYCSFHTTAGYLEQRFAERLGHDAYNVQAFIDNIRTLFPEGADYRHDQLHLRTELSEAQRACEPRNADSHLTFISSGLVNCATYQNAVQQPVYFIDLDGVNGDEARTRRTTVLGFNESRPIERIPLSIPVSNHRIDSVNLREQRLGLFDQLHSLLDTYEIAKGRIDITLSPEERHAGLTINEYETLLMQHDLVDVLHNPFRFMAEKSINMLRDPLAIPVKAKNYAKYDLVHLVNKTVDKLGLSESVVERILDKFLSMPASRFLRMKRSVSLMVSDCATPGTGRILQGRYQSPILVQWEKASRQTRRVEATFVRFE